MTLINVDEIHRLIPLLDEVAFASLCNSLLVDSAVSRGIDRNSFRLNLNTKEGDGGIDASCTDATATVPGLIPRSSTDFQYKSGRSQKSVARIVDDDILKKKRVIEGLKAGHGFVYLAGWDRSDSIDEELTARVRNAGLAIDDGQIIFVGAEMLTQRIAAAPALIRRYFNMQLDRVFDFERWAGWRTMSNQFVVDDVVAQNVENLRARIRDPGSLVRLVGSAGDGKTRMVLEALRNTELTDSVLYANQADEVTGDLINHLMRTRDVRCTLVIDEVDDRAADQLENLFEGRPPGVRIVLIGLDATGRPQPDTLQVTGLSNELLVALIRTIAAGVPDDIARAIAEDCERSPKLAVLIASRIRDDPSLVRSRILGDRRVQSTLDTYLPIEPGQPSWRALSATSLLMRLGWTEEAAQESTLLFETIGLDPTAARADVQRLHDRHGIAPAAGRFRYVSPAILGDHLAAGEISAWTRERMAEVFRALTPTMADSFARRARRLTAVLENATVVEEVILGNQGPFRSLTDVESGGAAIVIRHLVSAYPRATLAALERIIDGATVEELRDATNSRRELVWALEELLWSSKTFETAARLLLRLAIAENETWGNNASNTWPQTFQTLLGRTEADWKRRVRVVQEAARSEFEHARVLAARAIEAAFKSGTLSRSGTPPLDSRGMPMQEWRPATYGEWSDSLVAYLDILETLLRDDSADVRAVAAHTIGTTVREVFFVLDRVAERWRQAAERLVESDFAIRNEVLKSISWALDRWPERQAEAEARAAAHDSTTGDEKGSPADEAKQIAARLDLLRHVESVLAGSDLSSEFRRAVSRPLRSRFRGLTWEQAEQEVRRNLERFAETMIAQPSLMDSEWQWLLDDKEWRGAERWAEVLGETDTGRVFERALEQLASKSSRAIMWLSLYDIAHATKSGDAGFIDVRASRYIEEGRYAQTADLLFRAGYTPERFRMLLSLLTEKRVPASALNQFAFGSWGTMPAAEARQLLDAALGATNQPSELIQFVSSRITDFPGQASEFREPAMRILADAANAPPHAVDSYQWSEIAKQYVSTDSTAVVEMVLKQIAAHEASHDGTLTDSLQAAWESGNKQELFEKAIAPWLDGDYLGGFWVRSALETINIEQAGQEFLIEWVRKDPAKRAYILAEVIGPPHSPMSDVQAALLSEFSAERVGSAFWARFRSGTWVGSHADWIRSQLLQAKQWAEDPREPVRSWALEMIPSLEEDLRRWEGREAEERFR